MSEKEFMSTDFKSDERILTCPVCDCYNVHPVGLECISPGNEKGHVLINNRGIHLDPEVPPCGKGVKIILHFTCGCSHAFDYEFHFSEDKTLVDCQTSLLPSSSVLQPKTIWRK
ncbi:MAG: hypothetical protein A2Y12_10105 [Planctomycetes bacterium GWF2_42_9]|nr:MAG: hypothetical protein A2Y12_10105 [Planctomycetes bacterium GWF2_42_9]